MENNNKLIGHTFGGRYTIVSVVGVGGMSVVYGAYDRESGETVAVKVLDDSSCADDASREEAARRFRAEADAMSMLSHPNIVNIRDTSKEGEPLYFVMEYVEANTLKRRIEDCGALTLEETLHYSKQILKALIHTHSQNIIHCDVKPQNIMLLQDGSIKLTDFGIARFIDSEDNVESDKAVGTVYYISPEQASGKRIDGRSDIYSLGVMMYEMATGRLPFSAEDTAAVSRMHIEQTPMRPRVLDPEIPCGLEQIILHAMEKTPFMRFPDAQSMLDAVETLEKYPDIEFNFNRAPDDESENEARNSGAGVKWWVFALLGAAMTFIIALVVTVILVIVMGGKSVADAEYGGVPLEGNVWNTETTEK